MVSAVLNVHQIVQVAILESARRDIVAAVGFYFTAILMR